ncbi:CvpA family protein [Rubrivirga marina]|uniref:Colicin V production protein n=1 Tax=Rubrivirga marina TaxID=1196024 RepID=A0A271J271_9BACT|nr:CvpA family protein [Rubrivirga marina]PAP77450.1 hypothetical protein BSZ37_13895 [Rubrivirga marina]
MNGLDGFLAVVIAFGLWRGLRTGALLQVVGTAGWLVGFLVATALMGPVGDFVVASLGVSPRVAPVVGFVVVLGAVLGGLMAIAHALRKTLKAVKLGGVDTLAGGGLGALRSAFGLSVLLITTSFSPLPGSGPLLIDAETRDGSVLYEPVEALAPEVWSIARTVTPGLQEALVDKFNSWQVGEPESVTGEEPLE